MVTFRSLSLLKQTAREANPTVAVSKGTPTHDLWLTIAAVLLEPFYDDLEEAFGDGYSFLDFSSLSDEDMDTKSGNLIMERVSGNDFWLASVTKALNQRLQVLA